MAKFFKVRSSENFSEGKNKQQHLALLVCIVLLCLLLIQFKASAQCPPNIDFESGTFDGWTCYTGYTSADNNENQINISPSGPILGDRHTIFNSNSGLNDP